MSFALRVGKTCRENKKFADSSTKTEHLHFIAFVYLVCFVVLSFFRAGEPWVEPALHAGFAVARANLSHHIVTAVRLLFPVIRWILSAHFAVHIELFCPKLFA